MQTFLPYQDFQQSAKCLDNKRLGKQRVEVLQILKTLAKGSITCTNCKKTFNEDEKCQHVVNSCYSSYFIKTPWYNHPAVKMWRGYEYALSAYGLLCCWEWKRRGFRDNICEVKLTEIQSKLFEEFYNYREPTLAELKHLTHYKMPPWLIQEFCLSHQSNLIRKDPTYYRPIFGSAIPENLPYIWPIK